MPRHTKRIGHEITKKNAERNALKTAKNEPSRAMPAPGPI
jgi:hypothetical protein